MGDRQIMAQSERINFRGAQGHLLAARLDRPDGEINAYALFAHCFTCTQNIYAASRIAKELTGHGIAVLRFDFTGIGASEGDFANTNFTSNVGDLVAAADHMRTALQAPALIIGHSLGGTAVLAAARRIAEARAVVTLGSPADAAHVVHNFAEDIDRIMAEGEAQVQLAGRPFTVKKQFIEDVRAAPLEAHVRQLGKALLVMHAPLDATVGVENASAIFGWAKHPKSFVSLDDADHLISRREDAEYAGQVIATWAKRYF